MDNAVCELKTFARKHPAPLIAFAVMLAAYVPSLIWMWEKWFSVDSYYSHGIMIPFVSAFLVWQQRAELKTVPLISSPWGLPLIISGIGLNMLSALFRVGFTAALSMYIVFIGLILYFFGSALLKKVIFPVAFLIFMFPLPSVAIVNISFRMKMLAAAIAEKTLNQMGIPALRMGSKIIMQHAQVVVDDVCSGLRSLISLTALGSMFAYWLKGPMWKRVVLFLTTIPIAIVTNVCRVVFLSVVSEVWGVDAASGFAHDASGFMLFALAFAMLLGVSKVMEVD